MALKNCDIFPSKSVSDWRKDLRCVTTQKKNRSFERFSFLILDAGLPFIATAIRRIKVNGIFIQRYYRAKNNCLALRNCDIFPSKSVSDWRKDLRCVTTQKKNRSFERFSFLLWMQQLPIFPDRLQSSIFGASELNFCVRYENRWDLTANVTAMVYHEVAFGNIFFSVYILYTFFYLPSISLHCRFTTA